MFLKQTALSFIILFTANVPLLAQDATPAEVPKLAPPWVVQSEKFLMVAFNLKAADVRKLLPKGVEPLLNKEGMVGALLEMYETSRISGIPNYKTAFVVVDVQGHDSREGTPGHFALWGRVSPLESLEAFRDNFGFPYEYAENFGFRIEQAAHTATVGPPGREILKVMIAPVAEQPFEGQGIVNMLGMNADSGIVKSEVPYLTRGHSGKVLNFQVRPNGNPVLKLLKSATPLWAVVSKDQIFSYSHAVFAD